MICRRCGYPAPDSASTCRNCGASLYDEDTEKGATFVIGKERLPEGSENDSLNAYSGSLSDAVDQFYTAEDDNKGSKRKKADGRKIALTVISIMLAILAVLSCGYVIYGKLNTDTVQSLSQEDAQAILTAYNGDALSNIRQHFISADSDSSREMARLEALSYFTSLEKAGSIENVVKSDDGTKIYFSRSFAQCVFVMDDPTEDTYSACTIVPENTFDTVGNIYSADRDPSKFTPGAENNILILNSNENHEAVYKELDSNLYYFRDAVLNVNYIERATLNDYVSKLDKYNMIFIHAPSFVWKDGNTVLALNETASESNIVGYSAQLCSGSTAVWSGMTSKGTGFIVTPELIRQSYSGGFPDSLIYCSADGSYSSTNTALAEAFSSVGAQIFVGYSDSVSAAYEAKCVKDLAKYLISGKTIGDAYEFVTTKNGKTDGDNTPAKFDYFGVNDWSLYGWELFNGNSSSTVSSEQELFDRINHAMLALGTNTISDSMIGYRIIDADGDGAGEMFMMTNMGGKLTTNLVFETFDNAKIALDTSANSGYDYRTLYDSTNSQIYLCEQYAADNDAKVLYKWTSMGWSVFAKYTDEKSGTPTYLWDGKSISKAAFDSNLKKVSQGSLLNNWRTMLNLYYQTDDRQKIMTDIASRFKLMNPKCEAIYSDLDGDKSNECAIVLSGYGNEWLRNISVMTKSGTEKILKAHRFGTYVIYVDESDVGVVFRVAYISDEILDDLQISASENGGIDLYIAAQQKTLNVKFNGEVTDVAGYTVTERLDDTAYSLKGTWTFIEPVFDDGNGNNDTEITFDSKDDGKVTSKNFSFVDSDYKKGEYTHAFVATSNTISIMINDSYRTYALQWGNNDYISLTDYDGKKFYRLKRIS